MPEQSTFTALNLHTFLRKGPDPTFLAATGGCYVVYMGLYADRGKVRHPGPQVEAQSDNLARKNLQPGALSTE